MKNKKKIIITVLVALALLFSGGIIGYAASNGFTNLDAIKANFDKVLSIGKSQKQTISDLQNKLSQNENIQEQLKNQIIELQNNVNGKQSEIDAKQKEIDAKQREYDKLQQKIDGIKSDNDQLENKIAELKSYTDQKVREIEWQFCQRRKKLE